MQWLLSAILCGLLSQARATYTSDELLDMFSVGFSNIINETIDGDVTVESGTIPNWLQGNFMRHSCGVFGETDHMNDTLPNYIEHLFDCFEIGNKFKVHNGKVTFTNRWYDTTVNDIYNLYDRNMNRSSMFVQSTFSRVNNDQVDKWKDALANNSKVNEVPHVSWWQIGNEAVAMTESPIGVIIDPNSVTQKGWIQYRDRNLGFPDTPDYGFINNPAHEHTEPDGTLWSCVGLTHFVSQTEVEIMRLVYKVGADRVRHVVGTYHYQNADLTKCQGTNPYPDFASRLGYMHSFCLTKNYVILPETGYMHDPCFYTHYNQYAPFFPQGFHFEKGGFMRLLVMRKSDGVFIANITIPPMFVTHQDQYTTNVSRIRINMTDWTAEVVNLRPGKAPAAFEMSNINYAYNGIKYTYGYMAKNFDIKDQNAITKLNVDTGEELEYLFPEGMFVQEPQFVPKPGAVFEDDGVIIAQGVDGSKQKAFMVVIDAKTMKLMGHVTAPDLALFGLHNRFYPLSVGTPAQIDLGYPYVRDSAVTSSAVHVILLMVTLMSAVLRL